MPCAHLPRANPTCRTPHATPLPYYVAFGLLTMNSPGKGKQSHRSQFPGGRYFPSYLLFNTPKLIYQPCSLRESNSFKCPAPKIPSHSNPSSACLPFPTPHSYLSGSLLVLGSPDVSLVCRHFFFISEPESTVESFCAFVGQAPSSFWPGAWRSRRKSASVSWTPPESPEIPTRDQTHPWPQSDVKPPGRPPTASLSKLFLVLRSD